MGKVLQECCKRLSGTSLPETVSAKPALESGTVATAFALALALTSHQPPALAEVESDTGPPFAASFAEAILQRCLLGHAPPSLA